MVIGDRWCAFRPSNQNEELCRHPLRTFGMRFLALFLASAFCSCPAVAQLSCPLMDDSQSRAGLRSDNEPPVPRFAPFPLQLEMRVPFDPTAFASEGCNYLMYELHLTNFGTAPLNLSRIEVLDADAAAAKPIATFEQERLETMLQPVGGSTVAGPKGTLTIANGRTAIVFMSIALVRGSHIPNRLLRHVMTTDAMAEGAVISSHHMRCMCSGRRWKEQTGLQTMARVMTRTTIVDAEFSFSMAGR
jgi:hypothetical protein